MDVCDRQGMKSSNLLSAQRQDGENRWLFLAHGEKPYNRDETAAEYWTVRVPGIWSVEHYDAMDGSISSVQTGYSEKAGCTEWEIVSYAQDSFLYCLKPQESCRHTVQAQKPELQGEERKGRDLGEQIDHAVRIPQKVSVTLEEPNVLVLDMAESRLDDGEWREKEEILRLDNHFRAELGYPLRADAYAQPWIYGERAYEHKVSLRYVILSETERGQAELALENEAITELVWNGVTVSHEVSGYYVDRQIRKVILPGVNKGENVLEARIPYHAGIDLEAMYLLGDFGVRVSGRTAVITEFTPQLAFGDICSQGLPFYGGNIVYQVPVDLPEDGDMMVQIAKFRNPLIEVILDGQESRDLFISPYRAGFRQVKKGKQLLELRAYGNRRNTFGQLHNCNENAFWCGPDAWRTEGINWAYEYQLTPTGILASPGITILAG